MFALANAEVRRGYKGRLAKSWGDIGHVLSIRAPRHASPSVSRPGPALEAFGVEACSVMLTLCSGIGFTNAADHQAVGTTWKPGPPGGGCDSFAVLGDFVTGVACQQAGRRPLTCPVVPTGRPGDQIHAPQAGRQLTHPPGT